MVKNKKIEIIINEEKCSGCILCMLWCSYTHYKIFNPSKANLEIKDRYGLAPEIIFLDTCVQCGQCVQKCLYGALKIMEEDN